MTTLRLEQTVPVYSLALRETDGSQLFRLVRGEGTPAYWSDMLRPHRKDYYVLVSLRRGGCRRWVDMAPYVLQDKTFYFTTPGQLHVQEEPQLLWSTSLAFSRKFLVLQQHPALAELPLLLLQNP